MKISIIIPCYNSSQYFSRLRKSLNYYLNDSEIEIIFIDDKFSEKESSLLKSYVHSYNKYAINVVYLENEKNLGASISRKRGVEIAKGKYIAFLDADDAWNKDKLYIQFDLMEKEQADISGGQTICITEEEYDNIFYKISDMTQYKNINIYHFLLKNYFSTPSVMVKKESISKNNFSDKLRYSEDYECWRRILISGKGIYINSIGTYSFKHPYLSNSGSLSSNLFSMSIGEIRGLLMLYQYNNLPYKIKLTIPFFIIFSVIKSIRRFLLSYYHKINK